VDIRVCLADMASAAIESVIKPGGSGEAISPPSTPVIAPLNPPPPPPPSPAAPPAAVATTPQATANGVSGVPVEPFSSMPLAEHEQTHARPKAKNAFELKRNAGTPPPQAAIAHPALASEDGDIEAPVLPASPEFETTGELAKERRRARRVLFDVRQDHATGPEKSTGKPTHTVVEMASTSKNQRIGDRMDEVELIPVTDDDSEPTSDIRSNGDFVCRIGRRMSWICTYVVLSVVVIIGLSVRVHQANNNSSSCP